MILITVYCLPKEVVIVPVGGNILPRNRKTFGFKHKQELNISKIQSMFKMLRRALKRNINVDYILADSWFACYELITFVKTKPVELIAMFKMGES